jgi:homoserine O-acetyltransferase
MKYENFISDRTKFYKTPKPLQLELGATLNHVEIAYRTWGNLNPNRDNAILGYGNDSCKTVSRQA